MLLTRRLAMPSVTKNARQEMLYWACEQWRRSEHQLPPSIIIQIFLFFLSIILKQKFVQPAHINLSAITLKEPRFPG